MAETGTTVLSKIYDIYETLYTAFTVYVTEKKTQRKEYYDV